ncbi:MAG: type II toxin-antitoxin system VapC family toxin [Chloroflexi bacterium]|nr:type II toxin-antitoxin system VapC family toxin [Chloroflexota bacterium]
MLICIDSCIFIRGLHNGTSDAAQVLNQINRKRPLVIPRLIAQEVTRNLSRREQVTAFYRLFAQSDFAFIVEEPVPRTLVLDYTKCGLPAKADAFIGAFAEWMQVDYLVSDNRHFLRELQTEAYQVVTPAEMLQIWERQP